MGTNLPVAFIEGRAIYEDGKFLFVDRDAVLAQIAAALSAPRDADEVERHWLREQVFPLVEEFYDGYLQNTAERTPFYKGSSST